MDDFQHILVIDDDSRLRELLRRYLAENGFRVTTAGNAAEARAAMGSMTFDLLVLDRMMPGESGLDLIRALRAGNDAVPVLMLTAMGETTHRIGGLEAGADDYLAKPFEPRELLLRIRTILRRAMPVPAAEAAPAEIRMGTHVFDRNRAILLNGGTAVRVTTAEARLLTVLSEEPGAVLSREDLATRCAVDGGERAIDVQVARLRHKIEPDPKTPRYLQTVRGRGYVLRPD